MKFPKLAGLLVFASFVGACAPAGMEFRSASTNNVNNLGTGNGTLSCITPTNPGGTPMGIQGTLYYLPSGSASYSDVDDYIKNGAVGNTTYFWGQLNLFTQNYTLGFPEGNGKLVTTNSGQTLTENFAFDMRTQIGLSSTDSAGDYEFALLSDDGSVLNVTNTSGNFQTIVNNDGLHPTQFGCATTVIHLDATTKLNSQIKYYQGPRDFISLSLLWKKIPTGSAIDTTYCGEVGNGLFFDTTKTPSVPLAAYNQLLARGWAPLKAANFTLPTNTPITCN
jgi:hypothetical protein